jgi:hypothetical protein
VGQKLQQFVGITSLFARWIFFRKFIGPLVSIKKRVSAAKAENCGLSVVIGR